MGTERKKNVDAHNYGQRIGKKEQETFFVPFKKSIFKVALQYCFNVVMLFKTVFYLKFNFILKIDQKTVFY